MAHATPFDPVPPPGAASNGRKDRLVVVGVDRSKQFGKARLHTFIVKTLRRLFPALTVVALGVYGASAMMSADFGVGLGLQVISRILPENLTMNNPYYEGFTDDGGAYIVRAKTAQQDLQKPGHIKLNAVSGVLKDAKKSKTNLKAAHGKFDSKKSILTLGGGIDIKSEDGLKAKLKTALIRTKQGIITSEEPVQVIMRGAQINSDKLRIQQKKKIITFVRNVRTKLTPEKPKPGEAGAKTTPANPTAMLGSSDEPIDINSSRLIVNRAVGLATFKGKVKAVQADQTLRTPVLEVKFQEAATEEAVAAGTDGQAKAGNGGASGALPDASRIELITAPQPVIMTRGALEQLTGQSAVFDPKNQTAVVTGNVVMSSGTDRGALADVAEIDSKSDTILLTGHVVVSQGDNELRGGRLFVDRATGNSQMTPAKTATGQPGRIFAKLKQQADPKALAKQAAKPETKKESEPKAKTGPTSALSATAFKGDPNAPIEIEADRLDVNDSRKEAVFSGKVLVEQGPMGLSANELITYYTGEANLVGTEPALAGGAQNPAAAGGGTELNRIRANGDVFVKSKVNGQNAKGDWADIDMKANTVLLGGDVVLNQGKNVVRATSLKIDLTTGNALVETSPDETAGSGWASTTMPSGTDGATGPPLNIIRGNRPSAVFYPTQVGGNKKTKAVPAKNSPTKPSSKQAPQRPAAASSWDATTDTPTN